MEETITRYTATITKGDEYHSEGEEHRLWENEVEYTQKYGLRLETEEDNFGVTYYHLYPCTIKKIVFRLEPIEITTLEGGNRKDIGFDSEDNGDYDWKEHWP